jgi:hypothetical protein
MSPSKISGLRKSFAMGTAQMIRLLFSKLSEYCFRIILRNSFAHPDVRCPSYREKLYRPFYICLLLINLKRREKMFQPVNSRRTQSVLESATETAKSCCFQLFSKARNTIRTLLFSIPKHVSTYYLFVRPS